MHRWLLALVFALTIPSAPAPACPICDTGTGDQVRAGIADGDLGQNLLATVLPFAVVFGVTAVIHFGVPGTRRKHVRDDDSRRD